MTTHSIPHPHPPFPDLVSRTAPHRAVAARRPAGAHRAVVARWVVPHQLITLALGGILAGGIYVIGGPW